MVSEQRNDLSAVRRRQRVYGQQTRIRITGAVTSLRHIYKYINTNLISKLYCIASIRTRPDGERRIMINSYFVCLRNCHTTKMFS